MCPQSLMNFHHCLFKILKKNQNVTDGRKDGPTDMKIMAGLSVTSCPYCYSLSNHTTHVFPNYAFNQCWSCTHYSSVYYEHLSHTNLMYLHCRHHFNERHGPHPLNYIYESECCQVIHLKSCLHLFYHTQNSPNYLIIILRQFTLLLTFQPQALIKIT